VNPSTRTVTVPVSDPDNIYRKMPQVMLSPAPVPEGRAWNVSTVDGRSLGVITRHRARIHNADRTLWDAHPATGAPQPHHRTRNEALAYLIERSTR